MCIAQRDLILRHKQTENEATRSSQLTNASARITVAGFKSALGKYSSNTSS